MIGGYRPGSNGIDALLVGYYDETGLRFAGKVRAGFVYVARNCSDHRGLSERLNERRGPRLSFAHSV